MENIAKLEKQMAQWLSVDVLENAGFLPAIGTMEHNVLTGDNVGLLPTAGYDEAVAAGCNPTYTSLSFASPKTWTIKRAGVYNKVCFDDIPAEFTRGMSVYKLEENAALVGFFKKLLAQKVANSVLAQSFAGDTTKSALNLQDGIFKQLVAFGTNRVTVTANDKASVEASGVATGYMWDLIEAAPAELRQASDAEIIMTQAMWDALTKDIVANKGAGFNVSEGYKALYNGSYEMRWNGYRVVVIPALDKIISISGNVMAGYPYFALFTTQANLKFGTSEKKDAVVSSVELLTLPKEEETIIKAKWAMGTIVATDKLFSVLY